MLKMGNKRITIDKNSFKMAVLLLSLFVVILFSSCNPDAPHLCTISLAFDDDSSRSLSSIFDPLSNCTIYYQSISKSNDPTKAYGHMSSSSNYKKLTSNGILISQGLWEIKAIFKETDEGNEYTPSDTDLVASSGDIFINLNTQSIAVSFPSGTGGYIDLSSYELRNVPSSVSNASIAVNIYKYDEEASSFSSSPTAISVDKETTSSSFYSSNPVSLDSGLYYAVVSVTGTVSNDNKTLFTDCIGFIVRGGLTTALSGYCDTYYTTSTGGGGIVVVDPNEKPNDDSSYTPVTDIKNFYEDTFKNNTIYQLPDNTKSYELFPTNNSSCEKVISNNKSITIDLKGNKLITATETNSSLFTLQNGAVLNLINTMAKTSPYVGAKDALNGRYQTRFKVNGGKLNVGTDASKGNIVLKGCPASINPPDNESRHAPIDITRNGGIINLAGQNGADITIEDGVKGIATIENDKTTIETDQFNVDINLQYTSINTVGQKEDKKNNKEAISNYGIYLDGMNRTGEIKIYVGLPADKKTISTSGSSLDAGTPGYGIYITQFNGPISITIAEGALVQTGDGYGIYIVDCNSNISITVKGQIISQGDGVYIDNSKGNIGITIGSEENTTGANGSITSKKQNGIFISDSCTGSINITNYGTVEATTSGKAAANVRSTAHVLEKNGVIEYAAVDSQTN